MNKKEIEENRKLQERIVALKKQHNVVLFAHNYQRPEIQEIADVIGDSLDLALKVRTYPAGTKILYPAVSFVAETAKILNPNAQIYFPVPDAQCPMAAFCPPNLLIQYKKENPGIPIALYINSTTEAKQYADVIVTSSSALEICKKIQKEFNAPKLGFGPDKNLGRYIQEQTGIPLDIIPPQGHCYVHEKYTAADIHRFRERFPHGKVIVHPECQKDVISNADFTGSTTAMYKYIQEHQNEIIGIGTEQGLLDRAKHDFPNAQLYPLIDNGVCFTMKKFTLEVLEWTLQNLNDRTLLVEVPKEMAEKALKPINKMFELIGKK